MKSNKSLVFIYFSAFIFLLFFLSNTSNATPIPDIKANNSDGPITLDTNNILSITVSLNAGSSEGLNADWWVAADTSFGWHYYLYPHGWYYATDLSYIQPAYQGTLFTLNTVELLNITDLPVGTYTFYFGVDTNLNEVIDEPLVYDSVSVNVTGSGGNGQDAPQDPPVFQSNPKATAISSSQIDLLWGDTLSDNEDGFHIERAPDINGSPDWDSSTPIATVPANTTNYSDTGLRNFTTYHYRIRAYNSAGTSNWRWSFESKATTLDADLEPGFPVTTAFQTGISHAGQATHVLVGNIDNEPTLEIIFTGKAKGPLYAWNSDGTLVNGWPKHEFNSAGYPALGELSFTFAGHEIICSYFSNVIVAFSGSGQIMPGWPQEASGWYYPPVLVDINGDGLDEIFEIANLAYNYDGSKLNGWPPTVESFNQVGAGMPAFADLDGDSDLEIVWGLLNAFHLNGVPVNGFPLPLFEEYDFGIDRFPVIGDVDGDGSPEIILVYRYEEGESVPNLKAGILIISSDGKIEHKIKLSDETGYGTAPALADLDGDNIPEIIVQTFSTLEVWRGDGSTFPGWPVNLCEEGYCLGQNSPVVGDVDGDQLPDIVTASSRSGFSNIFVFSRNGILHPNFPKKRLKNGLGAVPAIADIDLDGRNEIIIGGHGREYSPPSSYNQNSIWVYDLGAPTHGPIEWGQLRGGPKHQGVYK